MSTRPDNSSCSSVPSVTSKQPAARVDRIGSVDDSALSSRVIFPSARSPNLTPITAIVAHKLLNRRVRKSEVTLM